MKWPVVNFIMLSVCCQRCFFLGVKERLLAFNYTYALSGLCVKIQSTEQL